MARYLGRQLVQTSTSLYVRNSGQHWALNSAKRLGRQLEPDVGAPVAAELRSAPGAELDSLIGSALGAVLGSEQGVAVVSDVGEDEGTELDTQLSHWLGAI